MFVAHRETLEMLREALSARAQLATGVFHEELSAARRDTEVARFRAADGPSLLVSTEAGGEGRNFEFCHRLVLYDLPWKPATVEQRIGRLDRIGRRIPVEIVYFRPASGIGADVVRLFERLGLFREPIAGLEPQLGHIEARARGRRARRRPRRSTRRGSPRSSPAAQAARTRIHEAAYQQLHREPYRAALGPAILARVPAGLDALMEQVVVNAASRLGFRVEQVRGGRAYAIEFGNEALVDSLPGVPGGSSFVGVVRSRVRGRGRDASTSSPRAIRSSKACWRTSRTTRRAASARLELRLPGPRGVGLVAIYKDGPDFDVVARSTRTGVTGRTGRTPSAADRWPAAPDGRPRTRPRTTGRRSSRVSRRGSGTRPHAVASVVVRSP